MWMSCIVDRLLCDTYLLTLVMSLGSTRSSSPQKCEISMKMSMGVSAERILQAGINLRNGGGGEVEASLCHEIMMSLAVQHLLIAC